jgi:hypothetical protein
MTSRGESAERQRDETTPERLDRNTVELLNELRIAGTGIQVMFAFLLMAPPIHHRLLFRHGEKPFLLRIANYFAIAGMACLALGFVGILLLISDVVIGGIAPVLVPGIAALLVGGLWFGLPLVRRGDED